MREKWHIAVINDDPDAAETLKDCFDQGAHVTVFTSCEELLEAGTAFDAYVTDTNLGDGMNGISCAGEIRRRNPTAVIVGTSFISDSEGDPAAIERDFRTIYFRFGANYFINSANNGNQVIVDRVFELLDRR